MQEYQTPSEDAIDQAMTQLIDSENSIDPALMKQFMRMRQRVGKHTIARRERAAARIKKRKNKR